MKKTAQTFGAPKPLPGQAGYKISETEILTREAKEMEDRLKMLHEKVKEEESAVPEKSGGARWKSARSDKGSIRAYAKDVQEKHKTKMATISKMDPLAKATAKGRREAREADAGNYKTKNIDKWTSDDVSEWLTGMMMPQYVSVFKENDISGSVLLDISLDDLDYMGITILGHRKVILKSIEDLRKNKRITMDIAASLVPSTGNMVSATVSRANSNPDISGAIPSAIYLRGDAPAEMKMSSNSSAVGATVKASAPQPTAAVHWSHIEPLSAKQVSGEDVPVNLADGAVDEAAERLAFQNAVMEWRRSQKPSSASQSSSTATASPAKKPASSVAKGALWNDPFSDGGAVDKNYTGNGLLDEEEEEEKAPSVSSRPGPKGALLVGALDEAKEHEDFKKAVQAWRTGSSSGGRSKSVAEKLAQEMEQQHVKSTNLILQQQEEARMRLHELRTVAAIDKSKLPEVFSNSSVNTPSKSKAFSSSFSRPSSDEKKEDYNEKKEDYKVEVDTFDDEGEEYGLEDAPLSPASSMGDEEPARGSSNKVEVSLLESHMGIGDELAESHYDVEEASTDDEK